MNLQIPNKPFTFIIILIGFILGCLLLAYFSRSFLSNLRAKDFPTLLNWGKEQIRKFMQKLA